MTRSSEREWASGCAEADTARWEPEARLRKHAANGATRRHDETMRGSVLKPDGRYRTWRIRWEEPPDPATGKRRQRLKGGFRTRRDAERALREILGEMDRGGYVSPTRQSVGQFMEEWLAAIRSTVRPTTWESYGILVRVHVIPRLGAVPLTQLAPEQLNQLYSDLLADGRRDGKGGLSRRTVRFVHTIIHRALRDACRWGRLARNVAEAADPPASERATMKVWDSGQLRQFFEFVREDRLYALWLLAGTTGMRRGELLGLRWVTSTWRWASSVSSRPSFWLGTAPAIRSRKRSAGDGWSPCPLKPLPRSGCTGEPRQRSVFAWER
ncbi:MAG: Arm DNA-binding domain-containing protein, partial [Actinomycetota bacterium]